ncbi:MAG TPA: DUF4190 domain-containing protein [Polyangia bacterium]|nr:DUF4190 domain-containing protein [Polyangia bacterium]
MTCTRCSATISPGAKFCPACGAAQPPEPVGGGMHGFVPVPQSLPTAQPPVAAPAAPRSTNGLAIASMVLGIVWIWWVGSILALVFGYVSKSQINASGGAQGGKGMAIAGIVLGWVGIGTLCIGIIGAALGK